MPVVYTTTPLTALWPAPKVEIGFASNPLTALSSITWTDVTTQCLGFTTHMGRQHELGTVEASTASILLDNKDRRFDPTNTSSTYSPNVLPMKRVRITAAWNAITYPIYCGFIDGWPLSWPDVTDSYVTLPGTDALKVLNLRFLTASPDAGNVLSGTRIANVLGLINWPPADQSIELGLSYMQYEPVPMTGTALQHLTDIAKSEQGLLFQDPAGVMTFYDRSHLTTTIASTTSQATFGDAGGAELPYVLQGIDPRMDDVDLWNDVQMTATTPANTSVANVTSSDGTVVQVQTLSTPASAHLLQEVQDTTSQTAYGLRSLSMTGLKNVSDDDVANLAAHLLTVYKDPYLRIRQFAVTPHSDPANLYPQVLGRKLWDRITVKRTPPGGGPRFSQDLYIEGIGHKYNKSTGWETTYATSPATLGTQQYLVFDNATNGKFDTGQFSY